LTLPDETRQHLLDGARAAVAAASALIRERMLAGFATWQKADRSFVTEVDLAVERLLRDDLGRRFPGHDILGEELERLDQGSDFQWIIDPIDGTLSFTRGIPLFGVIVGLFHEGQPLLGVIDHPALGLTYSGARGLGAWRNDRRLALHDLPAGVAIEDEPVAMGDRHQFMRSGLERVFDRLVTSHPRVRTYADCFGHTLAVQGSVGAMVDFGLKIWDICATQVLVEEAGGVFREIERGDGPDGGLYHHMVCGKPRVVDWAIAQITAAGMDFSAR
jgi:histidinol-phosphatase